jgi:hypothetical protein
VGRTALIGVLLSFSLTSPATADVFLSKETGLRARSPLTVVRAMREAEIVGGYDEVFMVERLSPRSVRLTVCELWYYVDGDAAKQRFCAKRIRVVVRLKRRVEVLIGERVLPSPD